MKERYSIFKRLSSIQGNRYHITHDGIDICSIFGVDMLLTSVRFEGSL